MRPFLPALSAALLLTVPVWAAEPQVTAVLLTQAGVATVEQEAKVSGDETLDVTVPFSQVDDVLKSLIVLDPAGSVQRVTLAGSSDETALADLPIPPDALTSTPALLQALVGQSIEIDNTLRSQKGRLMAVVEREEMGGKDKPDPVRRLVLSLLTDSGVTETILEPGATVRLADKALQARLDRALASLANSRDRSARTLSVAVAGQGERVVKLAYVVAAPVWKATYRLDLAPDGKTARLQGWAVLENRTGKDWKNIRLTLSSGQPVTFRQPLYASTWVDRPEVPLSVAKVKPLEADRGTVPTMSMVNASPVPAPVLAPPMGKMQEFSAAPRALAAVPVATADESLTQISLTLPQTISVAAGQSLSVPIVDKTVPAQQVLVWNTREAANALQAAVELTNAGDSSLPPGAVALYDGGRGFVGDGRLDLFPKGENRFISYARDVQAKLTRQAETTAHSTGITILRGVATRREKMETRTKLRAVLKEGDTRPILVDFPRQGGDATLVAPTDGVRETPSGYRISLTGGSDRQMEIVTQRIGATTINIATSTIDWVQFRQDNGDLPEPVRAALDKLIQLNGKLADAQNALTLAESTRAASAAEQKRLRESLSATPALEKSDLGKRYMKDLLSLEDALADQQKSIDRAKQVLDSVKKERDAFIATLSIP